MDGCATEALPDAADDGGGEPDSRVYLAEYGLSGLVARILVSGFVQGLGDGSIRFSVDMS